jgi:hypothetical protein
LDVIIRSWCRSAAGRPASVAARERCRPPGPQIRVVHTPVHASWLNQVELYFSVVQRKVLEPVDFASLTELEARLLAFGDRYSAVATPFEWRFTRLDLHRVLAGRSRRTWHRPRELGFYVHALANRST